jgi:hypothetical protein
MKEVRILLNEFSFTNLCKAGFLSQNTEHGRLDINLTKRDMLTLTKGEILTKDVNGLVVKMALQDIGIDLIREIVRRSPIFSEMYYEI